MGRVILAVSIVVVLIFTLTDTLLTQVRLHHAQDNLTVTRHQERLTSQRIARADRLLRSVVATKTQELENDTELRDELDAAESRLTSARQGLNMENFTVATVNACLNGVQGAVGALEAGNQPAAVSALQSAAVACETIEEGESPGGPVYPYDFPDPAVIETSGTYFAYGTNAAGNNIEIIESSNLSQWTLVGDALPRLASWAVPGYTWAPGVIERNGTFFLYYTVATPFSQCISVATANQPQGPFNDASSGPVVCQPSAGGSIDPSPFVDSSGRPYLVWKSNGGNGQLATIWSQPLAGSGTAMAPGSSPVALIQPSQAWEDDIVEGPSIWDDQGTYFLFYSGNNWQTGSYAEGVAACSGPLGPCHKPLEAPILVSGASFSGPGGASVFTNSLGQPMIAFHGWLPDAVGPPNPRLLFIRALGVSAGLPFVGGP